MEEKGGGGKGGGGKGGGGISKGTRPRRWEKNKCESGTRNLFATFVHTCVSFVSFVLVNIFY